ncbi:MAG: DUF3160 domain-containing protein [Planctomycetota bacterium]
MASRQILLAMLMASSLVCGQASGGQDAKPSAKTWQEAARENLLSAESISSLEKNRIVITNDAYKQIFSAYLSASNPLFITSDSLLNAYHVLYEESVFRFENAMAARLPPILRLILKNIDDTDEHLEGDPALVSAAKRRAVLVTGIALRLIDDSFRFKDDELDKILTQQTRRIVKAEGVRMPAWLGKPDASFTALDYSRYKPRGFYTRSERLKRYFRAVSWLQSIPFRVKKDEEFLAMLMLGNCVTSSRLDYFTEGRETESFFRAYSSFIGAGDDWDLMTAAREARGDLRMDMNEDDLQEKRAWLMKKAEGHGEGPQINDQLRFAPEDSEQVAEPNFRIISAHRTPSALLFQRTTDLRKFKRPYPNGLEISIVLGSTFARKQLSDSQKADLLEALDSCRTYLQGSSFSLYLAYLDALKPLLDTPEPDAPEFMKSEAWQAKSCNTALAGWAQLRHTWALQAKQTVQYLGMAMVPEGFVEPEPEFFGRMAQLADATQDVFKQAGAFEPDYGRLIAGLEKFRSILEGVKDEASFRKRVSELPREDMMTLQLPFMLMKMNTPEAERGSEAFFEEQRQWLGTLVSDIKKGQIDRYPALKEMLSQYHFDLKDLWERFEKISRRLEVISHKQLRQADLNKSEVAFIKSYGRTIAGIMLYGGNSYSTPRDDAPRVVDVYASPQEGGYLHVGIARPRKLYVLYPWKGRTVLCEGAVMPYYELVTTSRLTDESWKNRLDSERRPSIPKWMSSVVSGGNLNQPTLEDDH